MRPLEPLYKEHDITLFYVDLFDVFGPTRSSSHRLTFPDSSFDTILCLGNHGAFQLQPRQVRPTNLTGLKLKCSIVSQHRMVSKLESGNVNRCDEERVGPKTSNKST